MENIFKSFSNKSIYEGASFNFTKGCYSIVGPNGVGKTILLEMLAGVLCQDAGSIYLSDVGTNTSVEYKQKLTYVPGKSIFFPSATGNDFLSFILSVKKVSYKNSDIGSLIEKFKLTAHLNTKFSAMSLGTQKKLFLSTLAVGDNSIIILDEPSNGLDGDSNQVLCDVLSTLIKKSIVIIATHDPLLIHELSPTIIELKKSPTSNLEINNSYRLINNEKILQFN